jgi:hypothetical protein
VTQVHLNLDAVRRAIHAGAIRGLREAAEAVMAESDRHVPIESGRLDRSSRVVVDSSGLEAAVTYDTPYAVIEHERLDQHHDPGRRAKFLESAGHAKREEARRTLAAEIRRALGT